VGLRPAPLGDVACILVAEDNEANLHTIGDYLTHHGFRIVTARNGLEAVELALEERPAIILMDIQMPILDGFAAIQRIRTEPSISRVPIIALTALAMAGDRERCLAAGADDYIGKPIGLKDLLGRIHRMLGVIGEE
jgi:CheY-like chemotaxis protein